MVTIKSIFGVHAYYLVFLLQLAQDLRDFLAEERGIDMSSPCCEKWHEQHYKSQYSLSKNSALGKLWGFVPEFVNVLGAQESIPRIDSASLCILAGRYDNTICRTCR